MGSGFRTFASGEVLTSDNVQNYLMDQAVMVFAGTAARGSALPSPETGMTAYSTATGLQVYNGTAWIDVSTGYGAATGGAGTALGTAIGGVNYNVHTFTGDATLTVTKAGLFDVLVFGGGGGGAAGQATTSRTGGGGGAGAKVLTTVYLDANTTITIGAGGPAVGPSSVAAFIGSASLVGSKAAAIGGGAGVNPGFNLVTPQSSMTGGSGGGGSGCTGLTTGVASAYSSTDYGHSGGTGTNDSGAGGGGGAGAVGANNSGTTGGAGGAGVEVNTFIGGSSLFKGGGGGGGGSTGGAGGSSIGGAGGGLTAAGASASANTASGGGGGGNPAGGGGINGGAGGSGIVYIRYKV
jgi:hypothetical protein